MDEQRAWIKSRRKKRLRMLAAALALCLLVTTYPDILATLSAFAAGTQGGDDTRYVTGFADLPEEVREQTVPLGTGIEELTLPDALEAYVAVAEEEQALGEKADAPDKKENPDGSGSKEDNTVSGAGTNTEESGAGTDTETGDADGSTETDAGTDGTATDEEGGEGTGGATEGETGDGTDGTGSTGDNTGSGGDNTGSSGDNTGSSGDNTGSTGDNTGNTGSGGTENIGDNTGSTGDNTGNIGDTGNTENSGDTGSGGAGTDENNGGADAEQETPQDAGNTAGGTPAAETGNTNDTNNTSSTEAQQEQSAPEQTQGESVPQAKAGHAAFSQETYTVTLPAYAAENELDIETLPAAAAGDAENADAGAVAITDSNDTDTPAAGGTDEAPADNSTDDTAGTGSTPAAITDSNDTVTITDGGQSAQTEQVAIENITWESDPSYDEETEGVYVFTPVLPEGYAPAEGVSLPEITVTVKESEQAKALAALLELLRTLPDPEEYLTYDEAADIITEHEEMIDEEQLRKAREAADAYLEAYPDTDQNAASGADLNGGGAAAVNGASADGTDTNTDTDTAALSSLLARLSGLEHIRDTETDCMDEGCIYHYPRFVKERMNEDEIPELLTMEDLVEDYGVEEPESAPVRRALGRAGYAAAPRAVTPSLHPQTLMLTTDNENNAHTGKMDGDIDVLMGQNAGIHPIELSFTLTELPAQSAYLAVKAYDVDEDYGEHDYVYLNDDIYLPMDLTDSDGKTTYNSAAIGYLAGTNSTWNTTVLEIPLEKLVKGKNVISVTVATGWVVEVDWMQLILDGGAADSNIEEFSLKLRDSAVEDGSVAVNADVTIKQKGTTEYITEYTLSQDATGNALDACFGNAQTSEQVGLTMPLNSPSGSYTITGLLKDPGTETIKAVDQLSFWFIQGVGLGPAVSHTLTPDTLTRGSVTIRVSAKDVPEQGITGVTVVSPTRTVTKNDTYNFIVTYKQDDVSKTITYPVKVGNIDKTPPTITYTPLTILEDTPQTEAAAQFQAALSASDDRKLADNPFTYTLPANISYLTGTKYVTVKAADAAGNTATKTCAVTVTAKPLILTMKEPSAVSGSKDSFALKAVLNNTGTDTITKTGFVWGVITDPTLDAKSGSAATASPVKTKGAALSATATGIAYGVPYYVRAYATLQLQNGKTKTIYSESEEFGSGLPKYGTFTVSKVSGSTFTVTRTGGTDGKQTVYYRTVNGSAIGGTHFTHKAGSLVFADGETSKTVTVSEKGVTTAYNGKATTSYSNADRTYSLEIYRVEGGGALDPDQKNRSKTRTMTKSGSYTVSRSLYTGENERAVAVNANNKWVADNTTYYWRRVIFVNEREKNSGQGNKNFNVQRTMDAGTARENAYLKATAEGYYYRLEMSATETDNGYEHVWISNHAPNSLKGTDHDAHSDYESIHLDDQDFGHAYYTGRWEINYQSTGTLATGFPGQDGLRTGKFTENVYSYRDGSRNTSDNKWLIFDLNDTAHVWFAANGNKKNMWYLNSYTDYIKIRDTKEPQCIGVAPMANVAYLPGADVTVALVFDEIVDKTNSPNIDKVSIETNVGRLTYAGGADTNVLYFTGTVQSGSSLNGSGALKVTKINNSSYIKDMCEDSGSGTPSYSGSTNINVDASTPDVSITAQTSGALPQHKAEVTSSEATVRYAWAQSTAMPVSGWQTASSGAVLTERRGSAGTSETWYLHVVATASSGATTHKYQAFTFRQPDITAVSVRAGSSASSADVSDQWKTGKYIVAQYIKSWISAD